MPTVKMQRFLTNLKTRKVTLWEIYNMSVQASLATFCQRETSTCGDVATAVAGREKREASRIEAMK